MTAQESNPDRVEGEVLDIREVLSAIPFDRADADSAGALLTFTTTGDRTIVRVDTDGAGPTVAVQIATIEGITGMTLQQLLSTNLDIGC